MNIARQKELNILMNLWIAYLRSGSTGDRPIDDRVNVKEASAVNRCSEITIRRRIKKGELRCSKNSNYQILISDLARMYVNRETFNQAV